MEDYHKYITIKPEVRFGKPCIVGTRIAILDILQWLASGMSYSEILEDFPSLEQVHILAALTYVARREAITRVIAA